MTPTVLAIVVYVVVPAFLLLILTFLDQYLDPLSQAERDIKTCWDGHLLAIGAQAPLTAEHLLLRESPWGWWGVLCLGTILFLLVPLAYFRKRRCYNKDQRDGAAFCTGAAIAVVIVFLIVAMTTGDHS